jgi:hypothetical protein
MLSECHISRHGPDTADCRAIGVTPRTLEVWDDMGVAREMIDAGVWIEGLRAVGFPLRVLAHLSSVLLPSAGKLPS